MTKFSTRVKSIMLAVTMTIQVFAGAGLFSITAYADITNADGSITKTATLYVPTLETCPGNNWTVLEDEKTVTTQYCDICRGTTTITITPMVCNLCGRRDVASGVSLCPCQAASPNASNGGHGPASPHSYRVASSTNPCPVLGADCALTIKHYVDADYGYHAEDYSSTSKTFKVWPLTVVAKNGLTCSTSVTGALATDAAIEGKTVTITPSGISAGSTIKITNTGTGETKTQTISQGAYTFSMPAAVTEVTVEVVTIVPTTKSTITSLSKTYLDSAFSVSSYFTTDSTGTKTYSSSDTTVATVSGSTVTIKKAGSCTIKMNTAASGSYAASSASFTLNVAKATPTLSGITASAITYGQTLANSTISGTAKVGTTVIPGTWSFYEPNIVPKVADSNSTSYVIMFQPTDTNNVGAKADFVKLVVNKASGYITLVTASGITYGQTLADSTITGQFNKTVPGSFAWNAPSTKPDAGTHSFDWTYTPTDTANYSTQTGTASVVIAKGTPTVTVSSIAAITYGQSLADATVSGSAVYQGTTVPGSFTWQNGSATKPAVADSNTTNYTLVFTPTDTTNYNSVTMQKTVTVNKAPALSDPGSLVLSATDITYGQSLADSAISSVPAPDVPGSYQWVDDSIRPSVADSGRSYAVVFVPTDTANYDNVTGLSCSVIVNKATPIITTYIEDSISATAITYGESLADSTITGDTPVAGSYSWANPDIHPSVPDSDVTLYDVVFTPDDTVNYNTATLTTTLTVYPATPVITTAMRDSISALGIIYGDSLAASTLTGDTPVPGSYVWDDDTIEPSVADSETTPYGVTFVPVDDVNYTTVTGLTATLHVDKATPNVTGDMILTISATAIVYEQTLADSTLSGDTPVDGEYVWADDTIAPTVADSNLTEYDVIFVPDDTDNYNEVTGLKCKLTVTKATPVITDEIKATVSATAITYGDTLADSYISGDTPVPGSYTWADDTIAPSVSDSNTTPYAVVFTPTDTANYNNASLTLTLTVNPKTPDVTEAMIRSISASAIVYEQTLADSTLSGDTPIPGRYVWDDPDTAPSVSDSDTTYFPLSFVPDDNINYTSVSGLSTTLTVTKLSPVITQDILDTVSATAIVYGDTLSDSTLSGDTPRDGHWEWDDADIMPVVNDSNTTEYVIKYVPDDTDNYDVSYAVAKLTVNKYQPVLTADDVQITAITYGDTLVDAIITGNMPQLNGSDITGTYAWEDDSIAPDAGTPTYTIVFTPNDTANILAASFEASVTVEKAIPVISDDIRQSISATAITYGQTLADSTLSGDVPMAGHYVWKYPETAPTVADSNATPFDVLFVPDSNNYANAELSCTLIVNKKAFTFSQSDIDNITAGDLTYGQQLGESELSGDTPVPGVYHWLDESIVPEVDDENNYPVEFIPNDTANYEIVPVGDVHVNVIKADPVITTAQLNAITTTPLVYGQSLSQSNVYGEASVPGSFAWTDGTIKPSVADSETTRYGVIFTPDDTKNYNTIPASATVKVHQAIPVMPVDIEVWLKASSITYGQTLASSTLIYDGNGVIYGTFVWQDPTIKPEMADSDTTDFPVLFVPTDSVNYSNVPYTVKVHVNKAPIPNTYENLMDATSVKLGSENTYELGNVIHVPEYYVDNWHVSGESGMFDGDPVIDGTSVSFNIKDDTSYHDKSAAIEFTIGSRDYVDFSFKLIVNVSDCKHDGSTHVENRRAATCTEEGYTGDVICDICCSTIEYGEVIPKTEHTRKTVDVVPATCTASGFSGNVVCSVCGEALEHGHATDPIPHVEGEPVIDVPATETSTGVQSYYCIMCNKYLRSETIPKLTPSKPVVHVHDYSDIYSFDDCYHWRECRGCAEVADKGLHNYDEGEYITATCTTEGTVKYTCLTCGAVEVRLETPGHRLSDYQYSGSEHFKQCLICGEHFDVHTHVYGDWSVVKAPTDGELGEFKHECSICDYVEVEMLASDPTKTVPGNIEVVVTYEETFETFESFEEFETEEPVDDPNDNETEEPDPSALPDDRHGDDEDGNGDGDRDSSNPYTGVRNSVFRYVAFAIIAGGVMALLRKRKPSADSDV